MSLVVRTQSLTDPIAQDPAFTLLGRADWFALGMFLCLLVTARDRGSRSVRCSAPGAIRGSWRPSRLRSPSGARWSRCTWRKPGTS